MTSEDKLLLKQLLSSCRPSKHKHERVQILSSVIHVWKRLNSAHIDVGDVLLECGLFGIYADLLEDCFSLWRTNFPRFWDQLVQLTEVHYVNIYDLFPADQITSLVTLFKKYISVECWDCLPIFTEIACSETAKAILLEDTSLYNTLKQKLKLSSVMYYFGALTNRSLAWQHQILHDNEFAIKDLPLNKSISWTLLGNLSTHPDAKLLLPRDYLLAAAAHTPNSNDVLALLSDDNALKVLALLLGTLLETGKALRKSGDILSLVDLVLPLANLSVVESYKAFLGERCIAAMVQLLVSEKLIDSPDICDVLRSRQESSRALWNFAYEESNLQYIAANNGLEKLKSAMQRLSDPIIKKNIAGILYMFNGPTLDPQDKSAIANGHVMISYNWGNQPIVKQIAKSLKACGYKVWLDLEEMQGSTLSAMSAAIEQAEMVLICMSQQYKDSPNCRLEGEYCVSRRIAFIPLMMQRGYKPDGWLGITLGAKLWYDFSDETHWDNKMASLVKAIGNKGKRTLNIPKGSTIGSAARLEVSAEKKPLSEWSIDEVHEWMKSKRIDKHFSAFQKHNMDGMALAALKQMKQPKLIISTCKDIGIVEMGDILRIVHAIQNLSM